jgi:hypothetical protein
VTHAINSKRLYLLTPTREDGKRPSEYNRRPRRVTNTLGLTRARLKVPAPGDLVQGLRQFRGEPGVRGLSGFRPSVLERRVEGAEQQAGRRKMA